MTALAFPFADHRPLDAALADAHRARRGKLLWWTRERRSPKAWPGDRRQAQTVTVDGSEWWLEPSGRAYCPDWTVFRDGVEIARARLLFVARQTVARAVGAKIGG